MSTSIPAQLGPYEILARIGAGGMGEVYRARDRRLDRDVALKVVPAEMASVRFRNEAKAIAALTHPNIINVFDIGTEQGLSYITMELLEGESLRSFVSAGPVPWKRAAKIAASIADALRYAHARGIIHRDLKPENVFITREGMTKVLDFGLAHMTPRPQTDSADSATLTRPGTVMGTVGYMSPEQVRGEAASAQSDVFSLGCVLYEMLSGHAPFGRGSSGETIASILRDSPPDLRTPGRDVPEPLIRVVEHCLEKDPEQRFDSMADFAFALEAATEESGAARASVHVPAAEEGRHFTGKRISRTIALTVAVAIIIIAGRLATKQSPPAAPREIDSLAVLPFTNASSDRSFDYLTDGLTEAIINDLSPINGLKVMSRSSVFAYKGKSADPREVGSDLRVDAVVNGRVVPHGQTLSVNVELVDARDGHQIWGERFERPVAAMSDLERDLASGISEKLRLRLTRADQQRMQRRTTVNPDAYRLYLQGRYEWNKRTPVGLRKGMEFFRKSIDIDPTYAPAYAGIADSYLLLGGNYELLPPKEAMPMARKAALEALAIDDSLADAHTSLGIVNHEFEWDWPKAEREFRRAIELNPNYVYAHESYGQALLYRSRFPEAMRELDKAEELDPLSLVAKGDIAQAYWIQREYDRSIAESLKIIDLEPRFWLSHWFLGLAYAGKGDLANAAKALETAVSLGGGPATRGSLGYVYARMNRRDDALRILQQLREESKTRYISPAAVGVIYIGLGDLDHAYVEMNRAIDERSSFATILNVAPITETLRNDPRYPEFARRIGLPPLP